MGFETIIPTTVIMVVFLAVFTMVSATLLSTYTRLGESYNEIVKLNVERSGVEFRILNATVYREVEGGTTRYVVYVEVENSGSREVLVNHRLQLLVDYLPSNSNSRVVEISEYQDWRNVTIRDSHGNVLETLTLYPGGSLELEYILHHPPTTNNSLIVLLIDSSGFRASYATTYSG